MRNGTVISAKSTVFASVDSVEVRDPLTVVFHLKHADNFLLRNLATGCNGNCSGRQRARLLEASRRNGPFRFVSQQIDQDVVIERNPQSWSAAPKLERVRFAVVPDTITESLELEKGSGDVAVNSLPIDSLPVLAQRSNLKVEETVGNGDSISRVQPARSIAGGCSRAAGDRLRHRSRSDHQDRAARLCATGREPAAGKPLGVDRRCGTLRLQSGASRKAAGCGRTHTRTGWRALPV